MNCAEIAHHLKVIGDGKEAVGLVKLYRTGQLVISPLKLPVVFSERTEVVKCPSIVKCPVNPTRFFRRMNTVPGWNTDGCARTAKGRSVHNLLSILQIMNDWRPGASMMRWNAHRVGKPLM